MPRHVVMEDLSTLERIQRPVDGGHITEVHDHELALRHPAKG